MIDFSKLENKEILLKLGFSESKIEELAIRQMNGEVFPRRIRMVDSDGKGKLVTIPDSYEEVEERKKVHKKHLERKRTRQREWSKKKREETPTYRSERNNIWAEKKGFKNYSEYENAIYYGFNNSIDYYNYLEETKRLKREKRDNEINVISNLSDETKAYVAGFFDAEGCIRTDKDKGRLYVSINQTHFPVLNQINNMFNGSITDLHTRQELRKQAWCWTLISENTILFLESICPYSIEKRKQIELALKYQKELKINHNGGGHQIKITTEEYQQRKYIYNELRKLKNENETYTYVVPEMAKDIQINYLAGFFDGEGCVRINKDSRAEGSYTLFVSISNSNFSILELYQSMFGGNIISLKTEKEHYKKIYQWRVVARKALSFLKMIEFHTIVKKEQIKTAIEFKELQNSEFSYIGKIERKHKGEFYCNRLQELKKETSNPSCNNSCQKL